MNQNAGAGNCVGRPESEFDPTADLTRDLADAIDRLEHKYARATGLLVK
ncbi:hypothetical protein [Lysobacter sp. Root690]|nr:hypothetical protein [Lysobacter sp. Root690]